MPYRKPNKTKTILKNIALGALLIASISIFGYALFDNINKNQNPKKVDNSDIRANLEIYNKSNEATTTRYEAFNQTINSLGIEENPEQNGQNLNLFISQSKTVMEENLTAQATLVTNDQDRSEEFKEAVVIGMELHNTLVGKLIDSAELYQCVTQKFQVIDENLASLSQRVKTLDETIDKAKYTETVIRVNTSIDTILESINNWSMCWTKYQTEPFMEASINPMVASAKTYFEEIKGIYNTLNTAVQDTDPGAYSAGVEALNQKNATPPLLLVQNKAIEEGQQGNPEDREKLDQIFVVISGDVQDTIKEIQTSAAFIRALQDEINEQRL